MANGVGSGMDETCPVRGVVPPLTPLAAIACGLKSKELTGKGRASGPVAWTEVTVATAVEDVVPMIAPLISPWSFRPDVSGPEEPWVWKVASISNGRCSYVKPSPVGSA